ncbi:hypothetical protein [Yinghuangia seranimata]|uniref:hypothetical protein n=1 Tax=Yinghuangia seranimata TaxID=408067 RepID=UPI00248B46A6|nr:hypothetical protein [Yinghuangia seranimata]MDI2128209.1 hypothetical protein [Yinghuangia seranimata]
MSAVKRLAMTAGAAALAFGGVVGANGQAYAGGNGQQVQFLDVNANVYSVYISGTNQNGQRATACFNTPQYDTVLWNYWWKGSVSYIGFAGSNCTGASRGSSSDWVPTSMSGDIYNITL